MAVPEFYRFLRPTLESLADGQERHWRDVQPIVSRILGLTEEDLQELVPSGVRSRVADRVLWSLTYLSQAKLITRTGRGKATISTRGTAFLKSAPEVIRPRDLEQFPEFVEFTQRSGKAKDRADTLVVAEDVTPEEAIEGAFKEHEVALAEEVLAAVRSMQPAHFERLVVELMLALGYGGTEDSGRLLGRSGDGGVDGVIDQDKLGLDKIYLQAKRWGETSVGSKEVQAFVGALSGVGATKGVFITTSTFTQQALDYSRNIKNFSLSLVSGIELATLMIKHDIGVTMRQRFDLKRLDSDYFVED